MYDDLYSRASRPRSLSSLCGRIATIALSLSVAAAIAAPARAVTYSGTITNLANLSGAGGSSPNGGLTMDSHGNLFGTTYYGGADGYGEVFEVKAGTHTAIDYADFNGSNGKYPAAGVTFDSHGNMWGTTTSAGYYGYGNIWKIASGSTTITNMADFQGYDGSDPYAKLTISPTGDIYGTCSGGGAHNDGCIFSYSPYGGYYPTDMADFNYSVNGAYPTTPVIFDSSGNVYGTANGGGAHATGTVYEMSYSPSTYSYVITALASFPRSNPYEDTVGPDSNLLFDSSGNLWGTASDDGANGYGFVYEVTAGTHTLVDAADFNSTDGAYPYGSILFNSDGDLIGTASGGGTDGYGNIFSFSPSTQAISQVAPFTGTAGPTGVINDSSGNLLGIAASGGTSGKGYIFEDTAS